jgi:hypothetical protein
VTLLVRGRSTSLAGVPRHWTGPLPELSIDRMLPHRHNFAKIPAALLRDGAPDLGVLVWGLLRLSFRDHADVASYRDFAEALGLGHLSDPAVQKRFSAAIKPLLGTWIIRKRRPDNDCLYQAVVVTDLTTERYAILRACDLELLTVRPASGGQRCRPSDLADFCRWQLECGKRGWTADPLRRIAGRWNVGHTTLATSRDRLAQLGLLKVVQRSGRRYSDLVWLQEVYDPHWQVRSTPEPDAERVPQAATASGELCPEIGTSCVPISGGAVSGFPPVLSPADVWSRDPISAGPIKNSLTELLTEDLTDLGGTSVPPLGLVTREVRDAPPPASRVKNDIDAKPTGAVHELSVRLVRRHPVFARARPHFRAAVIARLAAALESGLASGHADRALARVAEEGVFDAECLLLKRALQQAWADQRVGMCGDCGGDRDQHRRGCAEFTDRWDDRPWPQPDDPGAAPEVVDPLATLAQRPVPDPDPTDDAAAVEWLIVQIARRLLEVSDREARLRAIVLGLRAKAPPGQHGLIDQAVEHVRYALNQSLAS